MKTKIYTFKATPRLLFFTSLLIGFCTSQTLAQVKSSKVSIIKTKHDFGIVEQGAELTYEYKFKNKEEDTLVIKNVRASCCIGETIGEKKKFGNGEEGEIKVTFNTSGRSGVQNKTVSILTNDQENQNVMLSFSCDIVNK